MKNFIRTVGASNMYKYSGYLDKVSSYAADTIVNKVKHVFGQEYYINPSNVNGKHFKKFLNKAIKDYDEKYTNKETGAINPFVELVKLDKFTFMYVATGRFIPGRFEESIVASNDSSSTMYLYIFGKNVNKFSNIINKTIKKDFLENSSNSIYAVSKIGDSYDITSMGFDGRRIDTLVYSNEETDKIVSHIDKFIKDMDFYKSKSIPYKTGILLYGEPGTGKSSIIKAVATEYKRNICQINIPTMNEIDFNILKVMLDQDTDKYIVVFEDIDTLYLNRDSNKSDDKDYNGIINKMLQFLDSNTSPSDVIFIATTNHIDRLDSAILREGRFDLKIEVKGLERKDVKTFMNLLECKYDEDYVISTYGSPNKDGLYNQSRLQNIIVRGKEERNDDDSNDSTRTNKKDSERKNSKSNKTTKSSSSSTTK